jgi:hypothetical protein
MGKVDKYLSEFEKYVDFQAKLVHVKSTIPGVT